MNPTSPKQSSRRQFLKTSTVAALGGALASQIGFSAAGSPSTAGANGGVLKVGLIGCGGRGTGAALQALRADKNAELTALGDVFEAPLRRSHEILRSNEPERVKVEQTHLFAGLDAYEKVIQSGVDVVLLCAPPGFRPIHFKAAVDAGLHIFCEKPMAVDGPGIRMMMEAAKSAREKRLAVVSGFCWRYDFARREAFQLIHEGAVGDIKAIYATYYTGTLSSKFPGTREEGWSDLEWQLRNWYNFHWLSGDHLVEQAVHSVDKIAWAMRDVPPIKAVATGGRQIPSYGNTYDHFSVAYEYADGTRAFMGCRQQDNCYNENADYIMGSKGVCTIGRGPVPIITGEETWRYRGPANDMYQTEHDELFASIRKGEPIDDGDWMLSSTLMGIMGTMAAYTGREVTWEQVLNSEKDTFPSALNWNGELAVDPRPMPGRTQFV